MFPKELRYAWRSLIANRGFAATAVACLALGIGVNTAIFSVVDGILLKPFPYPASERIVFLYAKNQRIGVDRGGISYADFADLRDRNTTFRGVAAFTGRSLTLADGASEPERYVGTLVSWNLFDVLGTPPMRGRNFGPDDDRPGAEPVALIAHAVWQNRYDGDPGIVGRVVSINGRPHTIVGVMPPRFAFPQATRVWIPIEPSVAASSRDDRGLQVFARLRPGVGVEQASSNVAAVSGQLASTYPSTNRGWSTSAVPLREWMQLSDEPRLMLFLLMGAVTLVLLVACSNVANLLLARASVRHREISIRSALGAGRFRIVRQLLTEAIMIGLASVPAGVVVTWAGLAVLNGMIPPDDLPYQWQWGLDGRSMAYMVAIAAATGLVFGTAPAVQASGASLLESLRDGGHGSAGERRAWLRNALVVAQVALAVILLIGSSLLVRSFLNMQGTKVGFDTAPLMTLRFTLAADAYAPAEAKSRRVDDIVRRVERLPGVDAAFASSFVPMDGGGNSGRIVVEGTRSGSDEAPWVDFIATTPHMRRTLGIALVRGRDLTDAEGAARSPVALVNQSMARRLWGGSDPIGRAFRIDLEGVPESFTVVGIVGDFKHVQGEGGPEVAPAAYVPYPFEPAFNTGLTVRVAGAPAAITAAIREQVHLSDPGIAMFDVSSMEERRRRNFWQYRAAGVMFALFSGVALVLASIGVYGVLSYSVSQRTQEIGVRVALGAARRDVMRLIVGQGLKLAAMGILLGVLGALLVTPVLRSVLYNVTPTDPFSFAAVALFLTTVACAASYFPARRATAVDAIAAIRTE